MHFSCTVVWAKVLTCSRLYILSWSRQVVAHTHKLVPGGFEVILVGVTPHAAAGRPAVDVEHHHPLQVWQLLEDTIEVDLGLGGGECGLSVKHSTVHSSLHGQLIQCGVAHAGVCAQSSGEDSCKTVPERPLHQSQDTMPAGRRKVDKGSREKREERGGGRQSHESDWVQWLAHKSRERHCVGCTRANTQHTLLMNLLWKSSGLLSLCLWKLRATPASQPTPR